MSDQLLDTASKHSWSLSSVADRTWNNVLESAIKTGWGPVTRMAEGAVVALMQKITHGELRVLTVNNIYKFPAHPEGEGKRNDDKDVVGPKAELRVVNDVFWVRLALMGDLGFAEAYMYGDVECDDLVSLFLMFLENRENLTNMNSKLAYLFSIPQKLTSYRFLNTLGNSRSNISAHYDISNEMFAGFLSEDMTYSCAIFEDLDGDLRNGLPQSKWSGGQNLQRISLPSVQDSNDVEFEKPHQNNGTAVTSSPTSPTTNGHVNHVKSLSSDVFSFDSSSSESSYLNSDGRDELHDAQIRKLTHIMRKARILPNQRILEIGSGWGSLAILIAQTYPSVTIDTLTLSVQQQSLARQRIAQAGFADKITVHLMDYRAMPEDWKGKFDRVISVEMIEAVGKEYLETYWRMVDWAMKKKGGVGVVQGITIPEARFERYMKEIDFIRKWYVSSLFNSTSPPADNFSIVFPGGFLPTLTFLLSTLTAGSSGKLIVDSVSNIGPHYARTLREWRRRFLDQFDGVISEALGKEYPDVMSGEKGEQEREVFKRKWLYYYCYCEVGFTTRTLGDHIITFTREGYQDFGCDVYE